MTIPVLLPLTGGGAFLGQKEQQALEILQTEVNQQGGVDGRTLHFAIYDDQTSPKVAVQDLAEIKGAPAILGPSLTATCNAVDATITNQMVDYCFSPVIQPKPHSYVFSAMESAPDFVRADLTYLKAQGIRNIGILYSNDASGHAITAVTLSLLKDPSFSDIHVVDQESYSVNAVSVGSQIAKLAAAKPQALFIWATGAPIEVALRGVSQSPLTNLPVFIDDGNMTYDEMNQYSAFLPHQLYFGSGGWDAYPVLPDGPQKTEQKAFLDGFKARGIKPDIGDAQAWDPALLIIDAYKQYGPNATAQQIHQFIESQSHWVGIFGTYDFTTGDQRGLNRQDVWVYRWNPSSKSWDVVSQAGGTPLSASKS